MKSKTSFSNKNVASVLKKWTNSKEKSKNSTSRCHWWSV